MRGTLFTVAAVISAVLCGLASISWLFDLRDLALIQAAVVLAILPALRITAGSRADAEELRRIDYGLCKDCGYDLQGSHGACPECGRPFRPHEKVKIRGYRHPGDAG